MSFKSFLRSNFAFVIYMVAAAAVIVILLLFGANRWLNQYTHHGEETIVPAVNGMYIEEARVFLHNSGLQLQIVDSTYNSKAELGIILEQNPPAGASTKEGRMVYVVTNARMTPLVVVPDLHDMSYRQAEATLHSLGMEVEDVQYKPSEFSSLVLDVLYEGESVEASKKLPYGAKLTLVVGQSAYEQETVYVPSLQGKTFEQARSTLLKNSLVVGAVNYDNALNDEDEFVVYHQEPASGKWVSEGSRITLFLSQNPNKKMEPVEQEEEFF